MNKEEFIGKLNSIYVGENHAIEEIISEYDKLTNKINTLEKHNQKLQLEAQKYFDLLMECEHGGDKE